MDAKTRLDSLSDDWVTIAAIAVLAYMLANILHEGFGHGGVALLSGAHRITVTTVSMNAELDTRGIAAAGTLVNLFAAGILWVILRSADVHSARTRFFLILLFAFNLFTGTGYFLFSGVGGFGDWQEVIHGLPHYWLLRALMIVVGLVSYFVAMRLVAAQLRPFLGELARRSPRCLRLSLVPYVSAAAIAVLAGAFNPLGVVLLWLSALPSTLGANIGLVYIKLIIRTPSPREAHPGAIARSIGWIGTAILLGAVYVIVLGRGVSIGG